MYMGRMIRIELYRAFHGKELKIALLLGGLLGLAHFVLEVIPTADKGTKSHYQPNRV